MRLYKNDFFFKSSAHAIANSLNNTTALIERASPVSCFVRTRIKKKKKEIKLNFVLFDIADRLLQTHCVHRMICCDVRARFF